jgi:hypothetical protein
MEQEIRQYNTNGQLNGYTELCIDKGCWLKGMFKNDNEVGYFIENYLPDGIIGDNGTDIIFYIK